SQQKVGGIWAPRQNLGGVALQLAATGNDSGLADVFVVGTDHAVYENSQSAGGWSGWKNLGGYAAQVAVGEEKAGAIIPGEDLFAIGTGTAVFPRALPGGNWENLGGAALKIATPQSTGSPDVIAIGTDHGLWDRVQGAGGWESWQSLGGSATDLGVGLN